MNVRRSFAADAVRASPRLHGHGTSAALWGLAAGHEPHHHLTLWTQRLRDGHVKHIHATTRDARRRRWPRRAARGSRRRRSAKAQRAFESPGAKQRNGPYQDARRACAQGRATRRTAVPRACGHRRDYGSVSARRALLSGSLHGSPGCRYRPHGGVPTLGHEHVGCDRGHGERVRLSQREPQTHQGARKCVRPVLPRVRGHV